jgi:hypothetical protein
MKNFPRIVALCAIALLLCLLVIVAQAQESPGRHYAEGQGALATGRVEGGASQEARSPEGLAGSSGAGRVEGGASQEARSPEGLAGSSGAGRLEEPGAQRLRAVEGLNVLYRFSGAVDDGEQGSDNRKWATSIHCSNIGASDAQIEVQIVQWNGTDVYTGTMNLTPNRNGTFSTQNTTVYFEDVLLGGNPGTSKIEQGSGLILSSHPKVICSAQVIDPFNSPPEFATALELYKY